MNHIMINIQSYYKTRKLEKEKWKWIIIFLLVWKKRAVWRFFWFGGGKTPSKEKGILTYSLCLIIETYLIHLTISAKRKWGMLFSNLYFIRKRVYEKRNIYSSFCLSAIDVFQDKNNRKISIFCVSTFFHIKILSKKLNIFLKCLISG